jgi:thiol-disulfide isomerase/thioredoxin
MPQHALRLTLPFLLLAACLLPIRAFAAGEMQQSPAPQASAMSEQSFRSAMALEGVRRVEYKAADGTPLTFATFIAQVMAGRSFDKMMAMDKSLAVMTIKAGDASPNEPEHAPKPSRLAVAVGGEIPPLPHADLQGRRHALANGRSFTLLSFFFAYCVPCIREIPALNALDAERDDLDIVSVTFDDITTAKRFVQERGLKTPIVAEAQGYIDAVGVKVYPTLALVSPDGHLLGVRSAYEPKEGAGAGLRELRDWLHSVQGNEAVH